jgi:hypothetical protein
VIGKSYNLYYSVWCHGEHELYNLKARKIRTNRRQPSNSVQDDPQQLHNLLSQHELPATRDSRFLLGLPIDKVVARLDSLLLVLKSCKGERCVKPWKALHPSGDVSTLKQALSPRFDGFYEREQVRVRYNRCEQGYIIDAEGPQFDTNGLVFRDGVRWSEWV